MSTNEIIKFTEGFITANKVKDEDLVQDLYLRALEVAHNGGVTEDDVLITLCRTVADFTEAKRAKIVGEVPIMANIIFSVTPEDVIKQQSRYNPCNMKSICEGIIDPAKLVNIIELLSSL